MIKTRRLITAFITDLRLVTITEVVTVNANVIRVLAARIKLSDVACVKASVLTSDLPSESDVACARLNVRPIDRTVVNVSAVAAVKANVRLVASALVKVNAVACENESALPIDRPTLIDDACDSVNILFSDRDTVTAVACVSEKVRRNARPDVNARLEACVRKIDLPIARETKSVVACVYWRDKETVRVSVNALAWVSAIRTPRDLIVASVNVLAWVKENARDTDIPRCTVNTLACAIDIAFPITRPNVSVVACPYPRVMPTVRLIVNACA